MKITAYITNQKTLFTLIGIFFITNFYLFFLISGLDKDYQISQDKIEQLQQKATSLNYTESSDNFSNYYKIVIPVTSLRQYLQLSSITNENTYINLNGKLQENVTLESDSQHAVLQLDKSSTKVELLRNKLEIVSKEDSSLKCVLIFNIDQNDVVSDIAFQK